MQVKIIIMSTLIVSITSDLQQDCKKWSDFAKSLSKSYKIRFQEQNTKYKKLEKSYNERFDLSCKNRSVQQVKLPCIEHEKRWQTKIHELITDRNKQFLTIDKLENSFRNCLKNLDELDSDLDASVDKYNKYVTISQDKDLKIKKLEKEIERSKRSHEYLKRKGLYPCLTAKKEGGTRLQAKISEIEKLLSTYGKLLEKTVDLETDLEKVRIEMKNKSDEFLKSSKQVRSVKNKLYSDKIAELEKLKSSLERQLDIQRETNVGILFNHRMFILGIVFLLISSLMLNFGLCCFKKNHKHRVPVSESISKRGGFSDSQIKCDVSSETLLKSSIDRSDTDGSQTAV